MGGAKSPLIVYTFRQNEKKEKAADLDIFELDASMIACLRAEEQQKPFGFCVASAYVMSAMRKLKMGKRNGGSNSVVFCYRCLFQVLPQLMKAG